MPPGGNDVCPFCVLKGRGLCLGHITRLTEYGVSGCDGEACILRRSWPTSGCCAMEKM
jgi:hypothetical protein